MLDQRQVYIPFRKQTTRDRACVWVKMIDIPLISLLKKGRSASGLAEIESIFYPDRHPSGWAGHVWSHKKNWGLTVSPGPDSSVVVILSHDKPMHDMGLQKFSTLSVAAGMKAQWVICPSPSPFPSVALPGYLRSEDPAWHCPSENQEELSYNNQNSSLGWQHLPLSWMPSGKWSGWQISTTGALQTIFMLPIFTLLLLS